MSGTVNKVYNVVIEDVVSHVRELFLEDGVDEQVLQELKQIWETKLAATKACDFENEAQKQAMQKQGEMSNGNSKPGSASQALKQVVHQVSPNNHVQTEEALAQAHAQAELIARSHTQTRPHHVQQQMQDEACARDLSRGQVQQTRPQQLPQTRHQQFPQTRPQLFPQTRPPLFPQARPQQFLQSRPLQFPLQPQPLPQPQTIQYIENRMVPIQITLPAQQDGPPRVLTIQVPSSALQGNQLHTILTGPVISATMDLPHNIACHVLQQHVNALLGLPPPNYAPKSVIQIDGAMDEGGSVATGAGLGFYDLFTNQSNKKKKSKKVPKKCTDNTEAMNGQTDGPMETSEEEDNGSEDDDLSDDIDADPNDTTELDIGPEEDPLNSDDDVTDEDAHDLFETDNVIVCQYDKITRCRNKWKFVLKDGIMNLKGSDYLFQKANGDAEW